MAANHGIWTGITAPSQPTVAPALLATRRMMTRCDAGHQNRVDVVTVAL
jgi:hypothetical protein